MLDHPSFVRCRTAAHAHGSSATTIRGVARYLRDIPRRYRPLWPVPRPITPAAWKQLEAARKADPDAKRSRTDKPFRRRYLASLNRREARAIACDGTLAGVLAYYETQATTQRLLELSECARLRAIVTGKPCEPVKAPSFGIPIRINETTARKHKAPLIMRGKDARVIGCKSPSHVIHTDGETEWKNGVPKKYTRATNDNYVRSIAVIRDPQTLDYCIHETTYVVVLPDGYAWDSDRGELRAICVASPADDYHPFAVDLLNHVRGLHCLSDRINTQRDIRLQYAAKHAAELADLAGVYVCLADSLRAGNCRAGSLAFAEKHNLNPSRHYTAAEILAQANGDASRVRLAITAASLRHKREEAAGFCNLADHTVQ